MVFKTSSLRSASTAEGGQGADLDPSSTWTMTFNAEGQLRWRCDPYDLGETLKSQCSVEVSSLGQKPPMAGATPQEVTFSELVSDSNRLTLRQEVL